MKKEEILKVLGIKQNVVTDPEEMARKLIVTFFPDQEGVGISNDLISFRKEMKKSLEEIGVTVLPYEETLQKVSFYEILHKLFKIFFHNSFYLANFIIGIKNKNPFFSFSIAKNFLKRKRIKKGVMVFQFGFHEEGEMAIDFTSSFSGNQIISVVERKEEIEKDKTFNVYFEDSMKFFARDMAHIVIIVDKKNWMIYSLNGSHPIYSREKEEIKKKILYSVVPKAYAPLAPEKLKHFNICKDRFNPEDENHKFLIKDMIESGKEFQYINIYPQGKSVEDLPFRNNFYKWIGYLFLDWRSGMSYGFMSRQMPVNPVKPLTLDEVEKKEISRENAITIKIKGETYLIPLPPVWVVSQRSGCNKTKMNPKKDLLKLGLIDGEMYIQAPPYLKIDKNYNPSFDTRVILAHALSNAVVSSIIKYFSEDKTFSEKLSKQGMALSHWHGYIKPEFIPHGWHVHGVEKPPVACSTYQSAIYAFEGKIKKAIDTIEKGEPFYGDFHIEPQHGTNITFTTLKELSSFLKNNNDAICIGNKYLKDYSQ